MIKQIWIARCDSCERVEPARMSNGVNKPGVHIDPVPIPPQGWWRTIHGRLTCTECQKPQEDFGIVRTTKMEVSFDAGTRVDS